VIHDQQQQHSSRPSTAAQSKASESPSEKLKKEQEKKKLREDAMKKWREKWTDREQKNASPLIVMNGGEPKTRNNNVIEMIKGKQIA
jgi:hypothetical protein